MKKKVVICAGVCGETVEATVESVDSRYVRLKIGKCCKHIERMKPMLEGEPLDARKVISNIRQSPIFDAAQKWLPHVTCPVPVGLSKLIEIEAGLNVPVDVSIKFETTDE